MKNTKKILMILYGYFPSDPRVRKEVISLVEKKKNNHVTILCLKEDDGEKIPRTCVIPLIPRASAEKRQSITMLQQVNTQLQLDEGEGECSYCSTDTLVQQLIPYQMEEKVIITTGNVIIVVKVNNYRCPKYCLR